MRGYWPHLAVQLYQEYVKSVKPCGRFNGRFFSLYIIGERERANLVVSTADFSLYWRAGASQPSGANGAIFPLYIYIFIYWRAGASQPSRFNGRFFSLYIYLYIYISGAGRHHTIMFYVILNTRTDLKFHRSISTCLKPVCSVDCS